MIQVRHPGGRRPKTVRHLPPSLQNFDDVYFDGANRFWIVNVSSIKSHFEPPLPLFIVQCPVYTKEHAYDFPKLGYNAVLAIVKADEMVSDSSINAIKDHFPRGVGLRVTKSGIIAVLYKRSSDLYSDWDLNQQLPMEIGKKAYSMLVLGKATPTSNAASFPLDPALTSSETIPDIAVHKTLPPLSTTFVSSETALKSQEAFVTHFYSLEQNNTYPDLGQNSVECIARQALIEGCEYRWHRGSQVVDRSLLWRTLDDNQHNFNTAHALGSILCLGRPTDDMTRPICFQTSKYHLIQAGHCPSSSKGWQNLLGWVPSIDHITTTEVT